MFLNLTPAMIVTLRFALFVVIYIFLNFLYEETPQI